MFKIILLSRFREEDFQRFTLNLLKLFLAIILPIIYTVGTTISTNFIYTNLRTITVQCLRILLSSFGGEDFLKVCIKFAVPIVFHYKIL